MNVIGTSDKMEQTTENPPLSEEITGLARPELIQVADAVAREKAIDREEVLTAMEQAIQKAGGRVDMAAKLLGLSRKGLFLKRRRLGIDAEAVS